MSQQIALAARGAYCILLVGSLQNQELDLLIHIGPFSLRMFYGPK